MRHGSRERRSPSLASSLDSVVVKGDFTVLNEGILQLMPLFRRKKRGLVRHESTEDESETRGNARP